MLERKKLPRGEEQCDFSKLLLHSQSLADYSSKNATRDLKFNKSSLQSSQSNANSDKQDNHSKQRSLMKLLNSTENKLYHEYLTLKNANQDNGFNKIKIAHIFNIQAINLINKSKCEYKAEVEKNRNQVEQANLRAARPLRSPISKEMRKRQQSLSKQNLIELDLVMPMRLAKEEMPTEGLKRVSQRVNQVPVVLNPVLNGKEIRRTSINRTDFDIKLQDYHKYIQETCQLHQLARRQIEVYAKNTATYYVGKGNNCNLIREQLKKRWWWTPGDEKNKKVNRFIWAQLKEKNYFAKQKANQYLASPSQSKDQIETEPQIHNHFENNEFLGNKKALYYNMTAHYKSQGKNVFEYLPVTFHIKARNDSAWAAFTTYFETDRSKGLEGQRLWIVKPGENTNRGSGITIHTSYDRIKELVYDGLDGTKTFIVQKYIDHPFLYNRRKFDIRCYMMLSRLNGQIKGYWYDQGYIRTSCYEFQLGECENQFMHLTNDAIQVNCDKYGKYEDGNKLSYHSFQKYLDANFKNKYNFAEQIAPQLKAIATDSIEATHFLLGKWNGLPTLEIFGLDFMIDQDFKPWLIEINTNPCLETSSSTLERVIPRMIDNAFKLTIDVLFPPPEQWLNSKKHYMPNRVNNNLFELIFDQAKLSTPLVHKCKIVTEMGEIEEDNEVYEDDKTKLDN